MDMLLLIIGVVAVIWYFGFVQSARGLARVANRAARDLELSHGEMLMNKRTKEDTVKTRDYLAEFDKDW